MTVPVPSPVMALSIETSQGIATTTTMMMMMMMMMMLMMIGRNQSCPSAPNRYRCE
jgi:hypothetical protein